MAPGMSVGWRVVALLYVAHVCVAVWRATFDVVLPSFLHLPEVTAERATVFSVLTVGTAAYASGKALAVVFVDNVMDRIGSNGPRKVLCAALLVPSCAAAAVAVVGAALPVDTWGLPVLFTAAVGGRIVEACAWPAMTRLVQRHFTADASSRAWGVLSTSSRVGYILADVAYGGILEAGVSWNGVFAVTSIVLVAAAVLVMALMPTRAPDASPALAPVQTPRIKGGDKSLRASRRSRQAAKGTHSEDSHPLVTGRAEEQHDMESIAPTGIAADESRSVAQHETTSRQEDTAEGSGSLAGLVREPAFWLITCATGALTTIGKTKSLTPFYLTDHVEMSAGYSAMVSSLFSVGAALSALAGGFLWARATPRQRVVGVGMALSILVAAMLTLTGSAAGPVTPDVAIAGSACVLVAGLTYGAPYYVPSNVFAIRYGKSKSGGLTAVLDIAGYGSELALLGIVSRVMPDWSAVWGIMSGVAVAALICSVGFLIVIARAAAPETAGFSPTLTQEQAVAGDGAPDVETPGPAVRGRRSS